MTTPKDLAERLRNYAADYTFFQDELVREAADLIERQAAEIAALQEANERFGKRQEWWTEQMFRLEQERDSLRADAERYRWLRDHASGYDAIGDPDNLISVWYGRPDKFSNAPTLDAAIDAAMAKLPPTWEQDTLRSALQQERKPPDEPFGPAWRAGCE